MPVRRCVGCGRRAPKSELIRLAVTRTDARGPRIVLDLEGRLPGRGAYLCRKASGARPDAACLERATVRRGLARTLRAQAPIDTKCLESGHQ